MDLDTFRKALVALREFPTSSPKSPFVPAKHKVVGMLGGEPMLHPQFESLCLLMEELIPSKVNRGLWTGLKWERTKYADLIRRVFGYVNNNQHNTNCEHSPILVSISDVVKDSAKRKELIDNCWLQRLWSATITPKGYFFCEVAGAFDMVFGGPGGLPIEPGVWNRPLSDFQDQIDRWCSRCGIPLNLKGRKDSEGVDDISPSNLSALVGSPRIQALEYALYNEDRLQQDSKPWQYLR